MNIQTIYKQYKLEIIYESYSKIQAMFGMAWVREGELKSN